MDEHAAEVQAGMERGELFLLYQPIVLLRSGECVGAEALVRWRRDRRVLAASEFMPYVENTPFSGVLTYWVIDTVATELADWLETHPDKHININVPPEILGRGGIEYAAVRSGLKARKEQIVLEITEHGIPDRLGLQALEGMAERGVRLALDDTLLSGANLALLARCHFSGIKLDRALISQLRVDAPSPAWLSGLAALLATSDLDVVAEGIEFDYQARMLLAAGVQKGQGHLYSAALTARELIAYCS